MPSTKRSSTSKPEPIRFVDRYEKRVEGAELEKLDPDVRSKVERRSAAVSRHMSPPGALGLPPLLEHRRLLFGITDGAFAFQPFHDKLLVHQIPTKPETYGGGIIHKTEIAIDREERECPVGVIVAAGAMALDSLRANGVDLGHIVLFQRLAPWRHETDYTWRDEKVMLLRAGDIVGSVDLGDALRSGKIKLEFDAKLYEHTYLNTETDEMWHPSKAEPFVSGDQ